MNVGIVGSRNFTDVQQLTRVMDAWGHARVTSVISGGAIGADALGAEWARANGLATVVHLPSRRYGIPQGYFERNSLIVRDSDILMAFFGPGQPPSVNKSGTMDTVRKALAKRIPVHLYFQGEP